MSAERRMMATTRPKSMHVRALLAEMAAHAYEDEAGGRGTATTPLAGRDRCQSLRVLPAWRTQRCEHHCVVRTTGCASLRQFLPWLEEECRDGALVCLCIEPV
mmetsp:Transcript_37787/g.107088  ORF Transcript_37787/g.107088 Transcript_37787/m.107088 type:complete len:103 (+) Transcript_37787:1025-1333(+)